MQRAVIISSYILQYWNWYVGPLLRWTTGPVYVYTTCTFLSIGTMSRKELPLLTPDFALGGGGRGRLLAWRVRAKLFALSSTGRGGGSDLVGLNGDLACK